jgi:RNA polymerase sigma-70 factor (ECF subfamily)
VVAALERGAVREAVTTLLQAYGREIRGYLRAVTHDAATADDAFSIFAEHAWRGLPGWRGESTLRTWIYRVAWNAAGRLRRDPWRRRRLRLASGVASRLAAALLNSSLARREVRAGALERLRGELDEEERSLLALRVDRRLPWSEVADIMAAGGECPDPRALRKRFERLKERLGRLARSRGLLPDA